jgi:hypothetical protein
MRIWTIHPRYLDAVGLVAAWREGLLAQKVLYGNTKGYTNHPQLIRFKNSKNQRMLIGNYLYVLYLEAKKRNYNFDSTKILSYKKTTSDRIRVTSKQIEYEFELLKWKLKKRNKAQYKLIKNETKPEVNEVFISIDGEIEKWEKPIAEIIMCMKNA